MWCGQPTIIVACTCAWNAQSASDVQNHIPCPRSISHVPLQGDVRYSRMTADEEGDEQDADTDRQSVAVHVQEPAGVLRQLGSMLPV